MRKVRIESNSLTRPGGDRGLGRYNRTLAEAYSRLGLLSGRTEVSSVWARIPKNEALHVTTPECMPLLWTGNMICSIQDLIPLDISQYSRFGLKSRLRFARASASDAVIANTIHTRNRILDRFSVDPAKVMIAPLPPSEIFTETGRGHPQLDSSRGGYVASLVDLRTPDPRKRYHWLEEAARAAKNAGLEFRVTGRGLDRVSSLMPSWTPILCGTDLELAQFFRAAGAFLYTSAYEGQGMPPLEAMATGTPVVAFENTAITEVVGRGGLLLTDPVPWRRQSLDKSLPAGDASDIAEALKLVCGDPAWVGRAREWAATYSQSRFDEGIGAALSRLN